ncbi:MAG: RagB/SusD family nutrient uptake outer membrane protein, partial [Bacteroidaceae bacterium]|nr:RagB/SusD family nutrient uptake outer membrane protein [Bacteroidaceae bacterium]
VEIAAERQREMAYQGHRWFDLRRTTQPEIIKVYTLADKTEETYTLEQSDERYTLRFPQEAVEANPELEIWNN